MPAESARPFDRVYTVTDYYDGSRRGIASFEGRPHAYDALFDVLKDEYAEVFELRAVDDETFKLAIEDWEIWLRWEEAFHAERVTQDTHPALSADRRRHDEIAPILQARLAALPGPTIRARARLRPIEGHTDGGRGRWLEVQWLPVAEQESHRA